MTYNDACAEGRDVSFEEPAPFLIQIQSSPFDVLRIEPAGGVVGDVYAGDGNSVTTSLVFGRRAGHYAAGLTKHQVGVT